MTKSDEYYLPEYIRFIRIDNDRGVLSAPTEKHVLEGESVALVAEVVPLLREGTTSDEIANRLQIPESTAEQLLERLSETGFVRGQAGINDDFLNWASNRPADTRARLNDTDITLLAPTGVPTTPPEVLTSSVELSVIDSLSDISSNGESPELLVTVAAGEDPAFHQAVLEKTWSDNIPWLPIRLVGSVIKFGPYTPPKTDACYNCYYQRLIASASNRQIEQREHREQEQESDRIYPSVVDSLVWSLAHVELISIVAPDRTPQSTGAVVEVDPLNMDSTTTDVLRLPGCEICGTN